MIKVDLIEKLPTSVSSFNTLRKKGLIYVDKTEKIHSIATLTKKFFLARPRRFGKSLLILLRHSKSNIAKGTIPREISHLPKGLFATICVPE